MSTKSLCYYLFKTTLPFYLWKGCINYVKVYHGQRASKVSCISNENKSLHDMG